MASLVEHEGCFVCDKQITGISKRMMTAIASHTNTPLIDKLQNFVGKEFVVIVNNSDAVCDNCTLLFDQLDELELELDNVRNVLRNHLTNKYPMCFPHKVDDNDRILCKKEKQINTVTVDTKGDSKRYRRKCKISCVKQKVNGKSNNLSNVLCFCSICKKQINEESNLRNHITENHISKEIGVASDQKTKRISLIFKCSVCALQFSEEQLCQDHIESCHINKLLRNDHESLTNHRTTVPNSELKDVNVSNTLEAESNKVGNLSSRERVNRLEQNDYDLYGSDIGARDCDVQSHKDENVSTCKTEVEDMCTLSKDGNSITDQSENEGSTEFILPDSPKPSKCISTSMKRESKTDQSENEGSTEFILPDSPKPSKCISTSMKRESKTDVLSENFCNAIEGASKFMVCSTNNRSESLDERNCNTRKNSSSFVCIICNKTCDSRKSLDSHLTDAHPIMKNNYCQVCTTDYSNKDELKNHIKISHIAEKLCTICSKRFRTEARFLTHVDFEHRDNLICSVCQVQFKCVQKLIAHEKGHKTEYMCEICCKILKTRTSLKSHQIIMHTREYPYICETCGKGFISKHALYEHKGKHSNESRYICDICGKGYLLYDTYNKHRNHHDNPYPKQCTVCHQNFRSSSRLSEHMRRKHTLERPYKCPHCPLSFHISNRLKNHIFRHTKQYPHTCALCKKGFPSRIKYASHLGAKHGDYTLINNRLPNNKERREEWLKFSRDV